VPTNKKRTKERKQSLDGLDTKKIGVLNFDRIATFNFLARC
jgi:hypothetical protein